MSDLAKAEDELILKDPVLGRLIERQRPVVFAPRTDYFYSLSRSIIGQQVSVASATAIFTRLQEATDLDPNVIVGTSSEDLKTIGLSRQKISYIKDLAEHFANDAQVYANLNELSDEDVITELTKVKGVGVWTAEMFLMFTLARLDVFAPDDVGLQRAMKLLYGWEAVPAKAELVDVAERWRPYRTVACWHLWKSLHNSPQ